MSQLAPALSFSSLKQSWDVFMLFAVPIGGGIPAGVLLAQSKGIGWLAMTTLYFISDVALALVFEPFMILVGFLAKHLHLLARFMEKLKEITNKTIATYGPNPGPFLLVMISFGVDPMTGRAAALTRGHSFLTGWAIAIMGDMMFFGVIMVSTIWLHDILGDGTWTAIIIVVLMIGIPALVRCLKTRFSKAEAHKET
jgi:hypothetical protein